MPCGVLSLGLPLVSKIRVLLELSVVGERDTDLRKHKSMSVAMMKQ